MTPINKLTLTFRFSIKNKCIGLFKNEITERAPIPSVPATVTNGLKRMLTDSDVHSKRLFGVR